MKRFLHSLLFVLLCAALAAQNTPSGPVSKNTNNNRIDEDLEFYLDRTLTINGVFAWGGTATFSGSQAAFRSAIGAGTSSFDGAWSSLTGKPTTLVGAGITNGAALDTIGGNGSAYYLSRTNHTGTQSADTITDGTTNKAYTATEKTKLAGVATGATANSSDATLLSRANHTGTQTADTITDGTTNKAYTATEKTKLAGVATGATANSSDATLLSRTNHTGTQTADTITDGTTNKAYTATEKTKLAGVATGATANSSDATLLNRANHTGSQAESTVTNLVTDLAAKAPLSSPAFTGTPTVPTASVHTSTTQAASTAFVAGEVAAASFYFDVKRYGGADSTGATDATTAITNTINAALAAGAGSVVYFPTGSYRVTSQITIAGSNITLLSNGATITGATDTQYRKFLVNGRTGVVFDGLTFDGLYSTATTGLSQGAIEFTGSSADCEVVRCTFNNIAKQGVYIEGPSTRIRVVRNTFNYTFCSIFADDNGSAGATNLTLSFNTIHDGISASAKAAFSGGIKISGAGSANTNAGHVIDHNRIVLPGEMGIEIQTWVNDTTLSENNVYGAKYAYSISGCERVSSTGNIAKGFTFIGHEVASSGKDIAITGLIADGRDTSGTVVGTYGLMLNSSANEVNITGGTLGYCSSSELAIDTSSNVTVTGVGITFKQTGTIIKNSSNVTFGLVHYAPIAGADYFVYLDSTNTNVTNVRFANNEFLGDVDNNVFYFYYPANAIADVVIENNTYKGTAGSGDAIGGSGAGTSFRRLIRNNYGSGLQSAATMLDLPVYSLSSNITAWERFNTMAIDASGSIKTVTLHSAVELAGQEITVIKSDSSGNAVNVSTTSSETINGAAPPYALTAQWKRATFKSNGVNWLITQSN